jgi:hypothetical protein
MSHTHRLTLVTLSCLLLATPASAASMEGTVTAKSKNFFTVHHDRPSPGEDLVTFKVGDDLLKGKVSPLDKLFKGKYADMRVGQHVCVAYHRDEKTGELVADRYYVMKVKPKEKKPAR